ncbi:MAG: (d)CMP kinase [Pseudomonadota bacterium]|nr:(d)CMP kinase [Pseudomonadota bacterium]
MTKKAKHPPTVIAIDGTAASGKGTLAQKIADHLDFAYLDTGLLYRATAFTVLKNSSLNGNIRENVAVKAARTFLPETLHNPELREELIAQFSSRLGAMKRVREALIKRQRDFAKNPPNNSAGAVLDGRDIGTIICPNADFKIFIDADIEVRTNRRVKELLGRGVNAIHARILQELKERDALDKSRNIAPLVPAKDAFIIDTSAIDANSVFVIAMEFINSKSNL